MIPEVKQKRKPKQQNFFDKYRAKLLTAAAVLTFATPAAITAVQNGDFNPLEAIQAVSGEDVSKDDISKKIVALSLNLLDSAGTEVGTKPVNPYSQYLLELKTSSLITVDTLKIGDFFYINLPKELDYSAVNQMGQDTQDFPYSLTVIHEGEEKKLRVEITNVSNFPTNAFKTEMQLPVSIISKEDQTIKLTASTIGGGSSNQEIHIKKREIKDISNSTTVAMEVYNPTNNEQINGGAEVSPYDSLGFKLTFTPEDTNLMPGDYFTVNLPTQMEYAQDTEVNYYSPEMQFVGTIDNVTKTMKCTILRVSQLVAPIKAMGIKVVAPFDSIRLPQNGGVVSLVASTEKNSISHEINLTAIEGKRDISHEVESLSFVLYDEQGQEVSSGSKVNPYKVYGMDIDIDMGTNKFNEQVAPGDYVDVKLPDVLNFDYVNEMVNDTPTFKSVGRIIRKGGGTYLRTTIERVPRAASNTVALKFKLHIPFNVNKLFSINEDANGVRIVPLILSTTNLSTPNFNVEVHNLGSKPQENPKEDLYSPPAEFLFENAGRTIGLMKPIYQSSQFLSQKKSKKEPYNIYTLVKIEKAHGPLGRWTPNWDKVAPNVDPTKLHWSASASQSNDDGYSTLPNAGPGNYINTYCIENEQFRWPDDGETPTIKRWNGDYRYRKQPIDDYFSRDDKLTYKTEAQKKDSLKVIKNIVSRSYPFVSEAKMRQNFGFEDKIRLSDMIGATQQLIWDILGINRSKWFSKKFGIEDGQDIKPWTQYHPEYYTVPLNRFQLTQNSNSTANMYSAWDKMYDKCFKEYIPPVTETEDVKILSTSLNEETGELTIYLSRQLDLSETGRLMVSTQGKTSLEQAIDSSRTAYSINVRNLIDDNDLTNRLDINLNITDEDAEVEFYAYYDSADSQDVMSCEIKPRDYSAQETIKFNRGKFEFKKVVSGTQYTIAGAEFKLTHTTTGHELIAVANKDGIVKFNHLASGTYTLKEISAPSGYVLIEKEYTVTVKENGEVVSDIKVVNNSYEISNPEVLIKLIKHKKGDKDTKLKGAIFELHKDGGESEGFPKQYKTDINGEFSARRLTNGNYTIKEIKAPKGYIKSDDEIKFTVKNGLVTRVDGDLDTPLNPVDANLGTVTNNPIFVSNKPIGELTIHKVSSEDANTFLPGAEFAITNLLTSKIVQTEKTNNKGEVIFKKLAQGYYSIKETKAPAGYKLSDKEWVVYVDENGSQYDATDVESANIPVDDSQLSLIIPNYYKLVEEKGSSIRGALDYNSDTFTLLKGKDNWLGQGMLYKGEFAGVSFKDEKLHQITNIHIKQATKNHPNDYYNKYSLEYYNFDQNQWNVISENDNKTEISVDTEISANAIYLINGETKRNAWLGLQAFELEEKVTDSNSGADVQRAAPFGNDGGHDVNIASKIMKINKEDGTYTQYIYINNYEKHLVWFDKEHFNPTAKITLPQFNDKNTVEYKVHKVPANRVTKDLQNFDKLEFSEYTTFPENTVSTSLTQGTDATELVVNFTPKAIPSQEEAHAAIIEVTAKYRDGFKEKVTKLDVTSTFEYYPNENSEEKNSATTHNIATIINYGYTTDKPITEPIVVENTPVNNAKIKITKIDADTGKTIVDNDHNTNARFGITTTPNPVANDDLSSEDILNGQAVYLDNGTYIFDNDTEKGNNGPGFEPGQYYLWEMRAPKGYAKLFDVIPFYITESGEVIMPSKQNENGEYVLDTEHPLFNMINIEGSDDASLPTYSFEVKNRKAEYPKTGSIGSIIFYMIGLTGMIGSAWMFTKKQ